MAASLGMDGALMAVFDTEERRIMGLGLMLIVWMFGQLCDVLDGPWPGPWGRHGRQGAWLDSMADLISAGLAPAFVGPGLDVEWSVTLGGEAWQAWWIGVPLW